MSIAKVQSGIAMLQPLLNSNPYTAVLGQVVDLSLRTVQNRQQATNERVDASANNFTEHTLTFGAAGEQRIDHKLDREPAGYNVISSSGDINVFQTSKNNRSIGFDATGTFPATIKVRVF
jgi:hypothetical protein